MKLSLNLFTHNLIISLRRKRRLLTTAECSKYLAVDPRTFYRYVASGKLKCRGRKFGRGRPSLLFDIEEARKHRAQRGTPESNGDYL